MLRPRRFLAHNTASLPLSQNFTFKPLTFRTMPKGWSLPSNHLLRGSTRYSSTTTIPTAPKDEKSSSISAPEDTKLITKNGLFGKWSLYPMFGFAAAIAVSKELIILNEEFLVACSFLTFIMASYTTMQEQVSTGLSESIQQIKDQQREITDIAIDHINRRISIEKINLTFPEDLKALHEEEVKMDSMAVDYENTKYREDVRTSILQKLYTLKALEDEERAQIKEAIIDRAGQYARNQFEAAPQNVKDKSIEEGVQFLERGKEMTKEHVENDPIYQYFTTFFSHKYTLEELGVSGRVKTFLDKEKTHK